MIHVKFMCQLCASQFFLQIMARDSIAKVISRVKSFPSSCSGLYCRGNEYGFPLEKVWVVYIIKHVKSGAIQFVPFFAPQSPQPLGGARSAPYLNGSGKASQLGRGTFTPGSKLNTLLEFLGNSFKEGRTFSYKLPSKTVQKFIYFEKTSQFD